MEPSSTKMISKGAVHGREGADQALPQFQQVFFFVKYRNDDGNIRLWWDGSGCRGRLGH